MTAEEFYLEQLRIGNITNLDLVFMGVDESSEALKELFFLMENYAHFKNGVE